MNQTGRVLICDDNEARAARWAEEINVVLPTASTGTEGLRAAALGVGQFARSFEALKQRQRSARRPADHPALSIDELDGAQVVVSDFDLTPADGSSDLDGETLKTLSGSFGDVFAYLVRNFTDAAYTVLVNQAFYQSTFDLSQMRFSTSNADLNVAGDDLRRHELWTGVSDGTAYRPWHWPRLLDVAGQRRRLAMSVDLGASVLTTLGLGDAETLTQFTDEQLEFLGPDPENVTFRDVTHAAGKFGRSTEHEVIPRENLPLAAVAVVCHWLERIVLPGQNVLIDAPHLAQRRPGVLTRRDRDAWATLSDLSAPDLVRELFDPATVHAASIPQLSGWMTRPVWAWHRVPRNVPRGESSEVTVFCEDVSAFHPLDDAWEYESSVPSPFTQRFVLHEGVATDGVDVEYWPQRRLFT